MDRRRFLQTVAGVGCTVGLAGCIGGTAGTSGDHDIGMTASEFRPPSLTVESGTTVVWRNTSKQGHTVTAYEAEVPAGADYFASGGFDSQSEAEDAYLGGSNGVLTQGEEFEHEFTVPGTYSYYCIPHEGIGMAGVITVEEPDQTNSSRADGGNTTRTNTSG